jgi:hypothetical protein
LSQGYGTSRRTLLPGTAGMYRCCFESNKQRKRRPAAASTIDGPGVCGTRVHLAFVENYSTNDIPSSSYYNDDAAINAICMEGVHICFYAADFQGLYQRLSEKQLIWTNPRFVHLDSCDTWEEAWASQTLRFKDIIDLSTGEKILELEHETRPLRQYLKVPNYEPK